MAPSYAHATAGPVPAYQYSPNMATGPLSTVPHYPSAGAQPYPAQQPNQPPPYAPPSEPTPPDEMDEPSTTQYPVQPYPNDKQLYNAEYSKNS